ncbi:hypothetical protein FH966_14685 [Lentibacillus cibarius]|uniref:LiaI-LiaF-like transmembrane region domain-containing protein n=1 Tax=Lentibacillus cibarius TaxID=2583219 RepID=A0A549YLT5_9BACI|nr:DUF5668 domain-containing protein [Lentibacillus cibarius]TRM12849.1 hypothetical protein FH966_14685 [Lentibacillus cibarius]
MKRKHSLAAYILISIGLYFLLKDMNFPIFSAFDTWPVLFIIIGFVILIHSYTANDYQHLFSGTIMLGMGIHFYGLRNYTFWIDHWGVYLFIAGAATVVRAARTKKGLILGIALCLGAILSIYSSQLPLQLSWIHDFTAILKAYWPIFLIGVGIFLLQKKK